MDRSKGIVQSAGAGGEQESRVGAAAVGAYWGPQCLGPLLCWEEGKGFWAERSCNFLLIFFEVVFGFLKFFHNPRSPLEYYSVVGTSKKILSFSTRFDSPSSPQGNLWVHDSQLAHRILDRFQTLPRNVYTAAPFGSWNVKCICSVSAASASVSTLSEPAADTNRNLGFPSHSSTVQQKIQLGTPPGIFVN